MVKYCSLIFLLIFTSCQKEDKYCFTCATVSKGKIGGENTTIIDRCNITYKEMDFLQREGTYTYYQEVSHIKDTVNVKTDCKQQ